MRLGKIFLLVFVLVTIAAVWLDRAPISTILGIVWVFILLPAGILLFRDWINKVTRPKDNPFDLCGKDCWEVSDPKDFSSLFRGFVDFLPEGSIMRFEGAASGELTGFYEEHAIPERLPIPIGTIWPKSEIYNLPATKEILQELSELAEGVPPDLVAIHFHVYTEKGVLIDGYDAFSDPLYVSKQFSEEAMKSFCNTFSGKYFDHLKGENSHLVDNQNR